MSIYEKNFSRILSKRKTDRNGRLCRVFAPGEDTRALRPNHAEGVYIINSARNCISSKRYALYIIKPQEDARLRVMRYSPKG